MIGGLSKLNRYLLAGAGAIGILAAGGMSAKAADVAQLEAQMRAMQAQMAALQKEVQEAKAAAANSGGGDLDLKVKWKGAPELSSTDGKFKFKVRGRVMTDYDHIDQDFNVTGRPDVSAVELRRARLGVEGVVFYDVKYKFEADFADNEVAIKDAYVAYAGLKPKDWGIGEIRFGNQYVYNSIEEITSSRFITFMERPAYQEAFFLDRQIGAAILAGSEHWSFQTGIYGAPVAEVTDYLQDQNAFSVRGTWAPINRDVNGVHQVLHLGASYRHRDEAEDLRAGPNRRQRLILECFPTSRSAIGPEGRTCIWLTASLPRHSTGIATIWSISRRPSSGDRSRCRANTPPSRSTPRARPSLVSSQGPW